MTWILAILPIVPPPGCCDTKDQDNLPLIERMRMDILDLLEIKAVSLSKRPEKLTEVVRSAYGKILWRF